MKLYSQIYLHSTSRSWRFHVTMNVGDKYFFATIEKYIYLVSAHAIEEQAYSISVITVKKTKQLHFHQLVKIVFVFNSCVHENSDIWLISLQISLSNDFDIVIVMIIHRQKLDIIMNLGINYLHIFINITLALQTNELWYRNSKISN